MKLSITILFTVIIIYCSLSEAQNFQPSPLITISGDNTEFDVYVENNDLFISPSTSFLVWVNKDSSAYTIYAKQISPVGDNIIVASDSNLKSNPHITSNKIEWQEFENGIWKIFIRGYYNDKLSDTVSCIDSTINDPQADINQEDICWIKNGNLFEENINKPGESPFLIDSLNCSSPILSNYSFYGNSVLYIKNGDEKDKLCYAQNYNWQNPWSIEILDSDSIIANPSLGLFGSIAFQVWQDSVWKIKYCPYFGKLFISSNKSCNYKDPFAFSYPQLTKRNSTSYTPFFVVYDSDSLNNKGIYVQPVFYPFSWDSLTNISKSEGEDYNPKVTFVTSNEGVYVAILWNHTQNNKTDIWMAKDIYNPDIGDVKNGNEVSQDFKLLQNYPNPFNPSTIIQYTIPQSGLVTIKVYDVLGSEVKTLVNQYQNMGSHEINFNARNLSSGIYYYQLKAGNFVSTQKMLFLK